MAVRTIGGITVIELDGSPIEERDGVTIRATMKIACAWDDRWTVVAEAVGANYGVGLQYPHNGGAMPVYCRRATMGKVPNVRQADTEGDTTGWAEYEEAEITLHFGTPSADDPVVVEGRAITETLEGTVFAIPLPAKYFRWGAADGDPLEESEAPVMHVYGWDYTITHHNILTSSIPGTYTVLTNILALRGKVNVASLSPKTSNGIVFLAETALCKPPTCIVHATTTDITYRFSVIDTGWNKYWRGDTQSWSHIYVAGGSLYRSYPTGDFSVLG